MASTVINILKRTASLAGATLASRMLGFLREILMAQVLGGGAVASAWNFAFKVPNLFRRIFGEGLLGTVLIPVIAQNIEKDGRESARQQFSTVFIWTTLLLCLCSTAISGGSLIFLQFVHQPHLVLACQLIPLLMPYCIFICLIGMITSALNSLKVFFLPAVLSLLLNLCMIGALLWLCPQFSDAPFRMLSSLAYAVLLSGLLELILILILMKVYHFLPSFTWKNFIKIRPLKQVWILVLPGLAGAVSYQFSVIADSIIAAWISPYAVSALSYSERLIYLPIGVFAVAFGTVSLTEMSGMAQRRDYKNLIETQFASMRYLLFLTIPLMSFMFLFHKELIRMFYYRGAFTYGALEATAQALLFYTFGIPAFAAMKVTLTGFYSRKEMKIPMLAGIFCNLLNLILNLILMHPLKQGGIALSTAICSYVNNLILLLILQKQLGSVPLKQTAGHFLLLFAISLPGLFPALKFYYLLQYLTGAERGFELIPAMAGAGICYLALYLLLAVLLELDEVKTLTRQFTRKRKGA
ncbi:MAG: murein biosynthesis integral membrane protein MurJ [Lentisphaeria bacterium]|nr:murein biosynthesis integral membrane protein MurJ [Lentisphaeria bacterium]